MNGAICLISGIVFAFTLLNGIIQSARQAGPKVGDVYVHANPGKEDDPNLPWRPFTVIYTVTAVEGNIVRYHTCSVYLDGQTIQDDRCKSASGFGQFDQKLETKPAAR